jgi:hypothetical protein
MIRKARRLRTFALLTLLVLSSLLLQGCWVSSLNRLYVSPSQAIAVPELAGTWAAACKEGKTCAATVTFQLDALGKSYSVEYKDEDGLSSCFTAYWLQIGEFRFLDLAPCADGDRNLWSFYNKHLVRTYSFWKTELSSDNSKLIVSALDPEYIASELRLEQTSHYPYAIYDCGWHEQCVLLTASSTNLQKLMLKYGNNEKAFPPEEALILQRQAAGGER